MAGTSTTRSSAEFRERAVRMVAEVRADHGSEWSAMTRIAELWGAGTAETVRTWCRQAEVEAEDRSESTSEESAEIKRLKHENAELTGKTAS